jgi:V8-like Glu-specific endopeptidase
MFRLNLILFLSLACLCGVSNAQHWDISAEKNYHNSVVQVQGDGISGSGTVIKFIKDDGENYIGLVLTASHCIRSKETEMTILFRNGKVAKGGKVVHNSFYRFDSYNDIALIEAVIPDEVPVMEVSNDSVKYGDKVEMAGYATGKLRHWDAIYGGQTINGNGHIIFSWAIQGDSGGPIIYKGKVIGVVCFGAAVSRYNERYIVSPINGTSVVKIKDVIDNYGKVKT